MALVDDKPLNERRIKLIEPLGAKPAGSLFEDMAELDLPDHRPADARCLNKPDRFACEGLRILDAQTSQRYFVRPRLLDV